MLSTGLLFANLSSHFLNFPYLTLFLFFAKFTPNKNVPQIVIKDLDKIDEYDQEKFYEILKYKAISNIDLPKDCNIIVTSNDIKKVSANIISLCQVIR